jgi:gluconate 2-dehydrogenase gamma chain
MAGQSIERRDALRMIAAAAAAANFPGFSRWTFACQHHAGEGVPVQVRPAAYQPQFFTAEEYRMVERLADLIIPSDGTPGAEDAGVSEFIDFMVWSDPPLQYRFRYGLAWLDARSRSQHGKSFLELSEAQQAGMLEPLAFTRQFRAGEEDGRAFFRLFRDYTVMGFYTSRPGLEQLDYPGLRTYSTSPECPHVNDREHRHLGRQEA